MDESVRFLNMDGLEDGEVRHLRALLHPSNFISNIEFPWSSSYGNEDAFSKANLSSLNVHAPAFEAYISACQSHTPLAPEPQSQIPVSVPYSNSSNLQNVQLINDSHYYAAGPVRTMTPSHQNYTNGQTMLHNVYDHHVTYSQPPKPFNGEFYSQSNNNPVKVSSFKLNPTVSSFVPSNIESFMHPEPFSNGQQKQIKSFTANRYESNLVAKEDYGMEGMNVCNDKSLRYSFVIKNRENSVMNVSESNVKVNESNAVKVHESNSMHVDTNAVKKVNDNAELKMNESVVVRENDNVVLKMNENAVSKSNENAVVRSNENIVMKTHETIPKCKDNTVVKVGENAAMNNSEIVALKSNIAAMKVADNTAYTSNKSEVIKNSNDVVRRQISTAENSGKEMAWNGAKQGLEHEKIDPIPAKGKAADTTVKTSSAEIQEAQQVAKPPVRRSWADIVSKGQKPVEKVSLSKTVGENEKSVQKSSPDQETEVLSIAEDKMSLVLGKHLFYLELNFSPVLLQPRGLINRRNWCYINATLQALLACPPFYTLLRDLPLGPGVERGKSSTPVIDSMVKVAYEFLRLEKPQEELTLGQPFQPDFIYDMLRDLKSDCLKGQQEDAEEFLSFILNGMHEEMVKIIKNYEKKNHLDLECDTKENGGVSDGEEEWQVIGSKHKGMVTRKVAEHKTPISDLLGGQIKSFLTTSGNKTSASIQPFFTLQLDVQSDNVTSVSEALKEMTNKEPIQGYTCAKTKQEVEAFSHIALQKLPPILILHLKRFVYNKNGGCKKVMKKTDYPLVLEISRDMFSPDVKKSQRLRQYKLFAVMYHDGEEAVKGHYISDVYNHGSQTWIRTDDRAVTAVTEEQVLSYSPPRVPYLLFYQES